MKNLTRSFLILCLVVIAQLAACTKKEVASAPQGASTSASISGKISLAPLLARQPLQPTAVIYLIARNAGETSGPPVAVKRFVPPFHFPIDFTLSSADAMMGPDQPFHGPFAISVRVAQSGSATPASPGDLEGEVESGSVQLGAKDVDLRITQVRQ